MLVRWQKKYDLRLFIIKGVLCAFKQFIIKPVIVLDDTITHSNASFRPALNICTLWFSQGHRLWRNTSRYRQLSLRSLAMASCEILLSLSNLSSPHASFIAVDTLAYSALLVQAAWCLPNYPRIWVRNARTRSTSNDPRRSLDNFKSEAPHAK